MCSVSGVGGGAAIAESPAVRAAVRRHLPPCRATQTPLLPEPGSVVRGVPERCPTTAYCPPASDPTDTIGSVPGRMTGNGTILEGRGDTATTAIVVMGVSGSGKSTVAAGLVERLGWAFAEGDDFHPPANVAKMRAGTPLDDDDRWPWLRT